MKEKLFQNEKQEISSLREIFEEAYEKKMEELKVLNSELSKLKEENKDLTIRFDSNNYSYSTEIKSNIKDKRKLLLELISTLDEFDEADKHLKHGQIDSKGINLIYSNLKKTLEKNGFVVNEDELTISLLNYLKEFEKFREQNKEQDFLDYDAVQQIFNNLKDILAIHGVESFSSLHELFNPDIHESKGFKSADKEYIGRIVEEWKKGYKYKSEERPFRYPEVFIGNNVISF